MIPGQDDDAARKWEEFQNVGELLGASLLGNRAARPALPGRFRRPVDIKRANCSRWALSEGRGRPRDEQMHQPIFHFRFRFVGSRPPSHGRSSDPAMKKAFTCLITRRFLEGHAPDDL